MSSFPTNLVLIPKRPRHNSSGEFGRDIDHTADYTTDRESTIGAAFLTQTISLDENTTVKFEIWDTAGQERYKSLAPMYYRNANCAVVVYDITQAVCFSASILESIR